MLIVTPRTHVLETKSSRLEGSEGDALKQKRELNAFEKRRIMNEAKQPGETSAEIFTTALSGIDRRLHVPVHCGP